MGSKSDLTEGSLRALLQFLDPDPPRAAEMYEKVRAKLTRLFEWRGCIPGDEYADETIDRAARRLKEGIERRPESPYLYFHGIALNMIRERWRKAEREPKRVEMPPVAGVHPFETERRNRAEADHEQRLLCLQDCLDALAPRSRDLVTAYHLEGKRKGLAAGMNIPSGALRLRIFRIRRQLAACLDHCMARRGD